MFNSKKFVVPPNPYSGEVVYDSYRYPANESKNSGERKKSGTLYISEKNQILREDVWADEMFFYSLNFYNDNKHYIISNFPSLMCVYDSQLQPNVWTHDYFTNAEFVEFDIVADMVVEKWKNTDMPLFCKAPQLYYCDIFERMPIRISDEDEGIFFELKNRRALEDTGVFTIPVNMECYQATDELRKTLNDAKRKILYGK